MELIAKPDEATKPEIPEDWEYDYLDQHSRRGTGHTPDKKKDKYYDGFIVWVSLADSPNLDSGEINESKITISKEGIANSSTTLFPKGTVILSRDAGVGKSAVAGCELCVSQHFVTWICNEETLHNWYLYYWLQFQKGVFERIAMGSTVKTIGLPFFQEYHVLLPPYAEQRAIAEALSDVDALIERLDALIAKKRAIKTATMQRLLTGQQRLPGFSAPWTTRRLGEVAELHRQQVNPRTYPDTIFSLYSIPAFDNDRNPELEYGEAIGSNKFTVPQGAVMVSKLNPRFMRVWAPKNVNDDSIASTEFLVFKPGQQIARDFLAFLCQSGYFKNQILQMTTGTTGSHQRIRPHDATSIELKYPSDLEEQRAIATILADMDAEIEALQTRRDKTQAIKQGMMQELLTGRTRLV